MEKLIVSDPGVMMGKPVIAGTRITVELILEKLAMGETVDQLLEAHPRLTREAIQAALTRDNRAALLGQAGALAGDETLSELRRAIYAGHGRPEMEKGDAQ